METLGRLAGKRVAIVIAEGYHEHELWFPYYRFIEESAEVVVAGPRAGQVLGEGRHGRDGLAAEIARPVEDILDEHFDAIYLPGGVFAPLALRAHRPTLELVRRSMEQGRIVAAICHALWILVSAGVVKGRRVTGPPDMADDIVNAGGLYQKAKAVQDRNLITAVYFGYLPEQFRLLIPAIEGRTG